MGINDSLATFNATVRTLLATVVVGGLGFGGWKGYQTLQQSDADQRQLAEVNRKLEEAGEEIVQLESDLQHSREEVDKLETAMRLIKIDHRLAKVRVLDVGSTAEGQPFSKVEFIEIDDQGSPIGEPRVFTLNGDEIRIDGLVVKFKDSYIESADLVRGTSLFSFRSIYGNNDEPSRGRRLDDIGARPLAYARGGGTSDFEQSIWSDFWKIAENPRLQEELGIRAIHGQANYVKAVKGQVLYVELRASDGASIRVSEEPPVVISPTA